MSTVDFTPLGVPRRYPDRVQLHAVLVPCVGRDAGDLLGDDARVTEAALGLVTRWRRRVHALADAGWEGMAGDEPLAVRNRTFACNCQPTFILTPERTRCCRKRDVCPFCWARQVREVWLSVDHAFFADQFVGATPTDDQGVRPTRFRRANFDLVEHADVLTFPRSTDSDGGDGLLAQVVESMVARRSALMKETMKAPGMRGAFETLRVSPTRDGSWRLEARRLFMVRGDSVLPGRYSRPVTVRPELIPSAEFRLGRTTNPPRLDVLNAVARACRYPMFLLRGDPAAAVAALRARAGRKTSEAYGAFRNRAARSRAAGG